MTHRFRTRSTLIGSVVVLAWLASACSGSPETAGAVGTTGQDAFVNLELTSFSLAVENTSGMTLTDVQLAITPYGAYTLFTRDIARLNVGEKREMTLAEFRGRDGTPLNLRVVRARDLSVTAVDLSGQKRNLVMPWKN
jgi:hypothetical protein